MTSKLHITSNESKYKYYVDTIIVTVLIFCTLSCTVSTKLLEVQWFNVAITFAPVLLYIYYIYNKYYVTTINL